MSILEFKFLSPGSSGIDFFAQTFESEGNSFIFSPVRRAVDAFKHLTLFKVAGILVIPVWPRSQIFSSSFQILLMPQFRALSLKILDPSFSSGQSEGLCF